MIFLGFDTENTTKIWVVRMDDKGEGPIIDWFYATRVDYLHHKTGNPATPNGTQVTLGKFSGRIVNPYYFVTATEETVTKFGEYLKEIIEKNKANEQKP